MCNLNAVPIVYFNIMCAIITMFYIVRKTTLWSQRKESVPLFKTNHSCLCAEFHILLLPAFSPNLFPCLALLQHCVHTLKYIYVMPYEFCWN